MTTLAERKAAIARRRETAIHPLDKAVDRFWELVEKTDSCWLFHGTITAGGYGRFFILCTGFHAHRFSWELNRGPIPFGLWVLHHCDNRKCIRPDHLFVGTCADNNHDMAQKGRASKLFGADNHSSKLTAFQYAEITRKINAGEPTSAIAREFGISPSGITRRKKVLGIPLCPNYGPRRKI